MAEQQHGQAVVDQVKMPKIKIDNKSMAGINAFATAFASFFGFATIIAAIATFAKKWSFNVPFLSNVFGSNLGQASSLLTVAILTLVCAIIGLLTVRKITDVESMKKAWGVVAKVFTIFLIIFVVDMVSIIIYSLLSLGRSKFEINQGTLWGSSFVANLILAAASGAMLFISSKIAKGETKAINITNDASVTGTFANDLVIKYLDKNADEQTYTLGFSATVIGANTWTADFNNSTSTVAYPAGSIAEAGINSDYQYISSGNYNNWLVGRSNSSYANANNKFITPLLHANAGEKLTFNVKRGESGSATYNIKVYVSTDRKTWGDPVFTMTAADMTSSFQTKDITFDAEGDYYVAFALYGVCLDDLIGLTKVDVAHDLYIKSVSWPSASINSGAAQSKPSVDIIPLTDETAEAYTVKYVCGETVLAEGTPIALTASANSSKTFSFNWTPNVESTSVYENTKVVFDFGSGVTFETEGFDLTIVKEPKFHFVKTLPSSKWNEPSNYTTPITFGKTNTADTQTFYVNNWGTAPLTVKSIVMPEGFTVTPAEQFVVNYIGLPAGDFVD